LARITRRTLLAGASGLALGAPFVRACADTEPKAMELHELSAVEAVAAMTRGDLKAEVYARALLERCAAARALNAFITLEPDRVLEAAREADRARARGARLGPLHGLPIPIKDSVNTRDYPTTAGTPALKDFRPRADAPIVATLRGAGAIVLGKTNLHELSYGWTSNNLAFGAVHNPYDPARIPGGSSGGTAAAVAAHCAPLGVAEDTEGSIRVPAALCGLAALRPTTGRYTTEGAVPISPLFDQVGPHARSVGDLALFDAVATGDHRALRPGALRGAKLALVRDYYYDGLDPEVERASGEALARLAAAGAELVEVELPDVAALIKLITEPVQDHDVRLELPRYLERYGAPVSFDALLARASADVRATFADEVLPGSPGFTSEEKYRAAVEVHLPRLRALYREFFARTGAAALVFPATMVTAPAIGEDDTLTVRGRPVAFAKAIARNIAPGSTAGLPGLVLPAGLSREGLPVALEFDGPAGSDRALLALGLSAAAALGPIPAPLRWSGA
jgi:indoleacetamide hydrolase